jgi:hypothetical protein
LSSSGQANVDEEDDIHIEDCDEGDDNSIDDEEEENFEPCVKPFLSCNLDYG